MSLEAKYRAAALAVYRQARPHAVVFRHEDTFRAGVPDTSISERGLTVWLEFKVADPKIHWRGAQSAEMRRLWSTDIPAYFVVWRESDRMMLIVPATANYRELKTEHYAPYPGYRFLLEFVERIYRGGVRI